MDYVRCDDNSYVAIYLCTREIEREPQKRNSISQTPR